MLSSFLTRRPLWQEGMLADARTESKEQSPALGAGWQRVTTVPVSLCP